METVYMCVTLDNCCNPLCITYFPFILSENIELLNINSVNILLKILEEPNDNIYFILINNNKKILPTLKSRCLNYKIHLTSSQSFDITNKILSEKLMWVHVDIR